MTGFTWFFLSMGVLLGCIVPPVAMAEPLDRMVATVNNEAVSESELEKKVTWAVRKLEQNRMAIPKSADLRRQVLEKVVLEKVQLDVAKKAKLTVDDDTLKRALENIAKEENLTLEQLKKAVVAEGMNYTEFSENIRTELLLSRLQQQALADQITVTRHEVEQFLKSHKNLGLDTNVEYRVRHLLLAVSEPVTAVERKAAEQKAEALVTKVRQGANFAQLAVEHSGGSQATKGGDLGWRTAQQLPTLFVQSIAKMSVGDVVGPIRNDSGFHLVFLEDKRIGGKPAKQVNEQALLRQQAMSAIHDQKFEEALMRWLRRIRDDARVDVLL